MNKSFRVSIEIRKEIITEDELELMQTILNTKLMKNQVIKAYKDALHIQGNEHTNIDIAMEIVDSDSLDDAEKLYTKDYHPRDNFNKGEDLSDL